jgi:hypothetical protein
MLEIMAFPSSFAWISAFMILNNSREKPRRNL